MIRAGSVGRRSTIEYDDWDDYGPAESYGDDEWDEKGRTMISHIYIAFDKIIRSIQFGYLENGALVRSKKYGNLDTEGQNFRVVRLNQDEYVTGLSGVLEKGVDNRIRNLTFHTNRRKELFGRSSVDDSSCSKIEIDPAIYERGEFGGFFGSYTKYNLSSIGIYLRPLDGVVSVETFDQVSVSVNSSI